MPFVAPHILRLLNYLILRNHQRIFKPNRVRLSTMADSVSYEILSPYTKTEPANKNPDTRRTAHPKPTSPLRTRYDIPTRPPLRLDKRHRSRDHIQNSSPLPQRRNPQLGLQRPRIPRLEQSPRPRRKATPTSPLDPCPCRLWQDRPHGKNHPAPPRPRWARGVFLLRCGRPDHS